PDPLRGLPCGMQGDGPRPVRRGSARGALAAQPPGGDAEGGGDRRGDGRCSLGARAGEGRHRTPDGRLRHGRRPADVGGGQHAPLPREGQPLRGGRLGVPHRSGGQPAGEHLRDRALGQPVRGRGDGLTVPAARNRGWIQPRRGCLRSSHAPASHSTLPRAGAPPALPGNREEGSMRNAWLAGLLWMMGCGGEQAAAPEGSATSELSQFRAELGAGSKRPVIAAGDDMVVVPASVFGTTTDIVARFLFVAVREPGGQVRGLYRVSEAADGSTFHYAGHLTCAGFYDFNGLTGNRAKV